MGQFLRFTPAVERYSDSTDGHRGDEGNQPLGAISHGDRDGVTFLYLSLINEPVAGLVNGLEERAVGPILTLILQKQVGVVVAASGEEGTQAAFRIFECFERDPRHVYRFNFKRRCWRGQLRHGIKIRFRVIAHWRYISLVFLGL